MLVLGMGALVALLAIVVVSERSPRPPPTTVVNVPLSVSCPSVQFCMAVDDQGNAIRFNGTSWTKPTAIENGGMTVVSCPNADFCAAGDLNGSVVTYDGRSWSKPRQIDAASASQYDLFGISSITTLSCSSAEFCVAGDVLGNFVTFNGRRWSVPHRLESRTLYTMDTVLGYEAIVDVSCSTATFCAATTIPGRSFTWNGASWSAAQDIVAPATVALDESRGSPGIRAISCPSPTFCAAIDPSGNVNTYDGATWSSARQVDATSASEGDLEGLTALSCPSPRFCMAVDGLGQALTYNGSFWSSPQPVDPTLGLSTVSCATSRFCIALNDLGVAYSYDGTSWSTPHDFDE